MSDGSLQSAGSTATFGRPAVPAQHGGSQSIDTSTDQDSPQRPQLPAVPEQVVGEPLLVANGVQETGTAVVEATASISPILSPAAAMALGAAAEGQMGPASRQQLERQEFELLCEQITSYGRSQGVRSLLSAEQPSWMVEFERTHARIAADHGEVRPAHQINLSFTPPVVGPRMLEGCFSPSAEGTGAAVISQNVIALGLGDSRIDSGGTPRRGRLVDDPTLLGASASEGSQWTR